MLKNDLKKYKALLILALLFFIGFGMFAILPKLILEENLWEQTTFLIVIGSILGLIFLISMLSSIYILVSTIKPIESFDNVIQFVQIIIYLFILNSVLPDDSSFDETLRMHLFIGFGTFIIIYNFLGYMKKAKLDQNKNKDICNKKIIQINQTIKVDADVMILFNIFFATLILSVLMNSESATLGGYPVYIIINIFIMYKYFKAINISKKSSFIYILVSTILLVLGIILFIFTKDFLNNNAVIKGLVFTLPIIYIFPNILKNYYAVLWKTYQ